MTEYNKLLTTIIPARFKVGQVITSSASLLGVAFAMYKNVDKDKRDKYKTVFLSAALAVFLTGVTEPIEFMFMFISPILYGVYAVITGTAFALADLINLRVHCFGFVEFIARTPMMIKAGITRDMLNFAIVSVIYFVLTYLIFNFLIKKLNIPTPGRAGNYIEMEGEEDKKEEKISEKDIERDSLPVKIIGLLGEKENIVDVDACMTRLRVTVKDKNLVAEEKEWKKLGAVGLIVKDKGVQAIYGPKADVLKSDIQDILGD